MNKSYVIWGYSGHAKVLASLIKNNGDIVIAFFDNNTEKPIIFPNTPLYYGENGFKKWLNNYSNLNAVFGVVAIGGHNGNDRLSIQNLFSKSGLQLDSLIHPTAFVCHSSKLGQGTQVLAQSVIASDCELDDACIINHKASLDHECRLGYGVHLAPGSTVCGCVDIGNNVFIGAGAIILPRLKIGENSIIGAGAVVTKNVPSGSIIIGNPGRSKN